MKNLVTAVFISTAALAAPQVEVTSFLPLERGSTRVQAGEICGRIKGETKDLHLVTIISDPHHNPGTYVSIAGRDGRFCHVIRTTTGTADVRLAEGGVTRATLAHD